LILTGIEIIDQFIDGTAGDPAKLDVFLIMPAAVPFSNVIGDGKSCSPHLVSQSLLLLSRKLSD
jgi:hypothetical protein